MIKPFHINYPIPTHLKSLKFIYTHTKNKLPKTL